MSHSTADLGSIDRIAEWCIDSRPFPDEDHARALGTVAFDDGDSGLEIPFPLQPLAIGEERLTGEVADMLGDVELNIMLSAALANLSAAHREILRIRYVEGLTVYEAADLLGIPVGTVSTRTLYALRGLRSQFTPAGESRPII